jgi:16S rRNA (guanine(966)-N(2))-methyltransferase RsmD
MRIISGTARGRKLAEFSGTDIRPTPDRVREALFSKLSSRLGSFAGLKVLELFAGSGAQALEAVSRGADSAILVDANIQATKLISENIKRCKFETKTRLLQADVLSALPRLASEGPFDLILLDPPYNRGFIPQVLEIIENLQLLADGGTICAESADDEKLGNYGCLELIESRKYGATQIHLYCLQASGGD